HTRFSRDWSSDVCSSDLGAVRCGLLLAHVGARGGSETAFTVPHCAGLVETYAAEFGTPHSLLWNPVNIHKSSSPCRRRTGGIGEIGRASCRERGGVEEGG